MISQDGEAKAKMVKKLHEAVIQNLEKKNEQVKKYADKGRKALTFEPGDWVWLHMRAERFPTQRKSKLAPRGDGPFRVLEKINDNAYKIELPGEFNISSTFNVADLSPFDAEEVILRSESSQEGGNDEDIQPVSEIISQIPIMRQAPRTRSGTKELRKTFNQSIEVLLTHPELESSRDQCHNLGQQHYHSTTVKEGTIGDQEQDHKLFIKTHHSHLEELPFLPHHKELTICISTMK